MSQHSSHFINPQLLQMAKAAANKQAFIPGSDPTMTGGAPPGGDPAAAGGAPPGMPPGGDPAAMGGAAPPPPPSGGGGMDPGGIADIVVQKLMASGAIGGQGGGGAGGGAGGGIKPKIDVNVEIMQMKKLLARIADGLGIQIPATEMVATPGDLNNMAAQQQHAGGAAAPMQSSIAPIEPIQGAAPQKAADDRFNNGSPMMGPVGLTDVGNKAAALAHLFRTGSPV